MADVSAVTNHFPIVKEGFITALSSSITASTTVVPLNSVTGYDDGDTVVLVVDPTDELKKQVFTGVIDEAGVRVTGVKWTEGTNQAHASGATVVDYVTATDMSMNTKGILVQHKQTGAHSDITADSITIDGALLSGAMTVWTPTWANLTVGNGTVNAYYKQIGKIVHFWVQFIYGSTSSIAVAPNPTFTLPVNCVDNGNSTTFITPFGRGDNRFTAFDISTGNTNASSLYMAMNAFDGTFNKARIYNFSDTLPFTWAAGDILSLSGWYEAV